MTRLRKSAVLLTSLLLVAFLVGAAFAKRSNEQPTKNLLAIEIPMQNGPFTVKAALPGRGVAEADGFTGEEGRIEAWLRTNDNIAMLKADAPALNLATVF